DGGVIAADRFAERDAHYLRVFEEAGGRVGVEFDFEHDGFTVFQHGQRELNVLARAFDVDESMAGAVSLRAYLDHRPPVFVVSLARHNVESGRALPGRKILNLAEGTVVTL